MGGYCRSVRENNSRSGMPCFPHIVTLSPHQVYNPAQLAQGVKTPLWSSEKFGLTVDWSRMVLSATGKRMYTFPNGARASVSSYAIDLSSATVSSAQNLSAAPSAGAFTGGSALSVMLHPSEPVLYLQDSRSSSVRVIDVADPSRPS